MRFAALAAMLPLGMAGCAPPEVASQGSFAPVYQGVQTDLLDGDLVRFRVAMAGARDDADVIRYAECAAAQYTLIRGYGFARQVRTTVSKEAGIWHADAVYTISPALPKGLRTIDAEVTVADCGATHVPTV